LRLFLGIVGASVAGYFAYLTAFGVNVVFWDDWGWETFLLPGYPTLASLWTQHNENIMFFPSILAVVIIHLTHWNSLAFMWLSAVMLAAVLGVMVGAFWGEIRRAPLLWVPLPFLVLSLAQYQNTLWAFQFAWVLVLLSLVCTVALLARPAVGMKCLGLAALIGVIGSYSSLEGLLVWPAGLVVLLATGRANRLRLIWCVTGVAVTVGYFADFSFAASGSAPLSYVVANLSVALQGVLITAGSIIPNTVAGVGAISSPVITEVVGGLILAAALGVIVNWLRHGRTPGPRAFCVALIVASILFDLTLIPGRLAESMYAGETSRYDTFMWPLLAGIYSYVVIGPSWRVSWKGWTWAPRVLLSAAVVAEVILSTLVGIEQGQITRSVRLTSADVLANWETAPPAVAAPYLLPPCANDPAVCTDLKAAANVLEGEKMSIFSEPGQVSRLREMGILPGGVPARSLGIPPGLRDQIDSSASSQRAWNVLSAVYWSDPSLQSAFPQTAHGVTVLLEWAVASGSEVTSQAIIDAEWYPPVADGFFLVQYESVYRGWVVSGKA
jgi:hypothetical protein